MAGTEAGRLLLSGVLYVGPLSVVLPSLVTSFGGGFLGVLVTGIRMLASDVTS